MNFLTRLVLLCVYQNLATNNPQLDAKSQFSYRGIRETNHEQVCKPDAAVIEEVLLDGQYKKYQLPNPKGVAVHTEFWIRDITSVSTLAADFEADIYISETWWDPGLAYDKLNSCKNNISLNVEFQSKIWKPETAFINTKETSVHQSPLKNSFILIYPNGTVWSNYRIKVKGPCHINLVSFPHDEQTCDLIFESFSYNYDEVQLQWTSMSSAVMLMVDQVTLPNFQLTKTNIKSVPQAYPSGKWAQLTASFTFKRSYGWYILRFYIPSVLIVIISWIGLAFGIKAITARTVLGSASLLALIMVFSGVTSSLPPISYVTVFDIWVFGSISFVVASLLELAVVGFLTRNHADCDGTKHGMQPSQSTDVGRTMRSKSLSTTIACMIDIIAAIAFPVMFILFNIIYWTVYAG